MRLGGLLRTALFRPLSLSFLSQKAKKSVCISSVRLTLQTHTETPCPPCERSESGGKEHRKKGMSAFRYKKILCVLCAFV